jgi:hypothetical protein
MLVEAAWAAARAPGPLRAFFIRIQSRRGKQVAAVATARKIAVLAWHLLTKDENYAWARPALLANKIRKVELLSDQPATKGRPTVAHMPRTTAQPANGSELGLNKPREPTRFVANWQTKPDGSAGAA